MGNRSGPLPRLRRMRVHSCLLPHADELQHEAIVRPAAADRPYEDLRMFQRIRACSGAAREGTLTVKGLVDPR